MRMKDQTETSMVTWKPSRGTSVTRPPSASLGEKAIEWTRKSSSPHVVGDPLEHRLELALGHHVHRHEDRRLDLARQRLDMRLRLLVEIGDRKLGAEGAEGAGAAPGDRAVVGDADDQALAAFEKLGLDGGKGHGGLSGSGSAGAPTSARVWRAIISSSSVGTTRSATRLAGVEMRAGAGVVGGRVELGAEPGEALGDAGADRRRVLADRRR